MQDDRESDKDRGKERKTTRHRIPRKQKPAEVSMQGRAASEEARGAPRGAERRKPPAGHPSSRKGHGGRRDDSSPRQRGAWKRERAPSPIPLAAHPAPVSRSSDTDTEEIRDAKTWGLTRDPVFVNYGNIQTWKNLYVPSGPLGDNTWPACVTCPQNDCLARSTGDVLRIRCRHGMTVRDRTKVRIFAAFNNIRGCEQHYQRIFKAIDRFASHASSDVIRKGLSNPTFVYTQEEGETLKAPLPRGRTRRCTTSDVCSRGQRWASRTWCQSPCKP